MSQNAASRYYQAPTSVSVNKDGHTRTYLVPRRCPVFQGKYESMVWTANSRVDWVANNVYKDALMWWVIADANPSVKDWGSVPIGTLVRLPNVETAS